MTVLDLCSYLGLGAVGGATLTLLVGTLLSLRYSPVRHWPHRRVLPIPRTARMVRIDLFSLHRWLAYATVAMTLSHPVVLLFQSSPRFRVVDLVWPIHSPLQPKLNLAGAGALYLLGIVLVSSLLRVRVGRVVWRRLHYLVFPAAVLLFLHSILTDPLLKDGNPDLLDGGKVFVEIATVLSLAAVLVRLRLRGRGLRAVAQGQGSESSAA